MKLLAKTNRIYLAFSLVIYLLTALAIYHIVRLLIYDEVENRLRVEKRDFDAYVRAHDAWSTIPYFVENKMKSYRCRMPSRLRKPFGHADSEPLRQRSNAVSAAHLLPADSGSDVPG